MGILRLCTSKGRWTEISRSAGPPTTQAFLKIRREDGTWDQHVASTSPYAGPMRLLTKTGWQTALFFGKLSVPAPTDVWPIFDSYYDLYIDYLGIDPATYGGTNAHPGTIGYAIAPALSQRQRAAFDYDFTLTNRFPTQENYFLVASATHTADWLWTTANGQQLSSASRQDQHNSVWLDLSWLQDYYMPTFFPGQTITALHVYFQVQQGLKLSDQTASLYGLTYSPAATGTPNGTYWLYLNQNPAPSITDKVLLPSDGGQLIHIFGPPPSGLPQDTDVVQHPPAQWNLEPTVRGETFRYDISPMSYAPIGFSLYSSWDQAMGNSTPIPLKQPGGELPPMSHYIPIPPSTWEWSISAREYMALKMWATVDMA
jgi:hypothetical protein